MWVEEPVRGRGELAAVLLARGWGPLAPGPLVREQAIAQRGLARRLAGQGKLVGDPPGADLHPDLVPHQGKASHRSPGRRPAGPRGRLTCALPAVAVARGQGQGLAWAVVGVVGAVMVVEETAAAPAVEQVEVGAVRAAVVVEETAAVPVVEEVGVVGVVAARVALRQALARAQAVVLVAAARPLEPAPASELASAPASAVALGSAAGQGLLPTRCQGKSHLQQGVHLQAVRSFG